MMMSSVTIPSSLSFPSFPFSSPFCLCFDFGSCYVYAYVYLFVSRFCGLDLGRKSWTKQTLTASVSCAGALTCFSNADRGNRLLLFLEAI